MKNTCINERKKKNKKIGRKEAREREKRLEEEEWQRATQYDKNQSSKYAKPSMNNINYCTLYIDIYVHGTWIIVFYYGRMRVNKWVSERVYVGAIKKKKERKN